MLPQAEKAGCGGGCWDPPRYRLLLEHSVFRLHATDIDGVVKKYLYANIDEDLS
jgi:hypothetical protein